MSRYDAGKFDVAVVGAGHAGCEAALACARLGLETLLFTINLDAIANMACNPNIGGTAKGHLAIEVDALGGQMGKTADQTLIQSRMLNLTKGPAVHSLRAQIDRRRYQEQMKLILEKQPHLYLKQAEITDLIIEEETIKGVITHTGAFYEVKAAILCTGTYLKGKIIIGDITYEGGPDGMFAASALGDSLKKHGIELMRLKTGTPPRINRNSVDTDVMEPQEGDKDIRFFSFENEGRKIEKEQIPCYLTWTNMHTRKIIEENLHRSPLFSGIIEGVGPRYCPSIEDKIVRFGDKERHQIFIEPMGLDTYEMYVQGLSSSLPEDVQIKMLRSIKGLENAQMMRSAYAIEYDAVAPGQLNLTLESRIIKNLYSAGQINGSSGYEEAAAQGIMAGINAAMKITGKEEIVIDRSQGYIGVLIDDIVTKGTKEPYRMMTSRAEYRLTLRQDNADHRLTPIGYKSGLITKERYDRFMHKYDIIYREIDRLKKKTVAPSELLRKMLEEKGSTPVKTGIKLSELLKRPEIKIGDIERFDEEITCLEGYIKSSIEINIKYEGYIAKQSEDIQRFKKRERKKIPEEIDYSMIKGLRLEAAAKLSAIRPVSIGQASRISGVSPADITVLIIYIDADRRKGK